MGHTKGFTLVELLVVVALIAIIAGFAIPQFGRMLDSNRVVSQTNSVVGLLNFARSEAVRRGARITVTSANNTLTATVVGTNEVVREMDEARGSLTVSAGAVTYRANGLTTSGADVTFQICADSNDGRDVTVTPGGRVTTATVNCS